LLNKDEVKDDIGGSTIKEDRSVIKEIINNIIDGVENGNDNRSAVIRDIDHIIDANVEDDISVIEDIDHIIYGVEDINMNDYNGPVIEGNNEIMDDNVNENNDGSTMGESIDIDDWTFNTEVLNKLSGTLL
jgi:hypothetical protein